MYQFKMNIDPVLLNKQLDDLAEAQVDFEEDSDVYKSLEGVLNLLGALRDQIELVKPAGEVKNREMTDRLAVAICEGFEDPLDDEEFIGAWQHLIDTRIAWTIRGSFGRIAERLIKNGSCTPPPEKSAIIIQNTFSKYLKGREN